MTRQHAFIPTHAPLSFSSFHPLESYNGLVPGFSDITTQSSFLERSPFQDFSSSRLSQPIGCDIPQMNTFLDAQVNSLNPLNPFKIPLFSTTLQYPVTHPSYLPTNLFYPTIEHADCKPFATPLESK